MLHLGMLHHVLVPSYPWAPLKIWKSSITHAYGYLRTQDCHFLISKKVRSETPQIYQYFSGIHFYDILFPSSHEVCWPSQGTSNTFLLTLYLTVRLCLVRGHLEVPQRVMSQRNNNSRTKNPKGINSTINPQLNPLGKKLH